MTAREYFRLAEDVERWKARAKALNLAITRHEHQVKGPGPAGEFGTSDDVLWRARQRIMSRAPGDA